MDLKLAGRGEKKCLPPSLSIYTDFLNSAVHLEKTKMGEKNTTCSFRRVEKGTQGGRGFVRTGKLK